MWRMRNAEREDVRNRIENRVRTLIFKLVNPLELLEDDSYSI